MFRKTISQAIGASLSPDAQEFTRYLNAVIADNLRWEQPFPGVEQVVFTRDTSLIKGQLQIKIYDHQDSQAQAIREQIDTLAKHLASLKPLGATVRLLFEFPPPSPPVWGVQQVDCFVEGVVERKSDG